jgi:hypothetical protein
MNLTSLADYGLVYLATPYSKYGAGQQRAFEDAAALAGRLVNRGVFVFSPIAHGHPMSVYGEVPPLSHELWLRFDGQFIEGCGALLMAQMTGWHDSYGMREEKRKFQMQHKPIFYLDPEELRVDVRPLLRIEPARESEHDTRAII